MFESIVLQIIKQNPKDRKAFQTAKKNSAAFFHIPPPRNDLLIAAYEKLVAEKKISRSESLESLLKKRSIRTASGIACITVMTKQFRCPGRCIFCPQVAGMPKSYLPDQPAMQRAVRNAFDPYRQVASRLSGLHRNGHATDKIELRIAGETWSAYPKRYQTWFVKRLFDALNEQTSRSLADAQKLNEKTKNRCVGMSIETRPDWLNKKEIKRLRMLGVTLVELGVQHLDNLVLQKNHRDHPVETTIEATKLLRDAGFKVVYHTMPNLLGSDLKMDLAMHKDLFDKPDFQPDQLKIYPCMLMKNTVLYRRYLAGEYTPYSTEELIDLLLAIKKHVPEYCRIIRVVRDIPSEHIVDGNKVTNLRQILMQRPDFVCRCIRCREPMEKKFENNFEVVQKIIKYEANSGREFFIAYESKDAKTLFGYVRLRLPEKKKHFIPELENAALIRELHVYGMVVPLESRDATHVQHRGLGMKLMKEAERIAKEHGFQKLAVIAGIGVRKYYEDKLGYQLEGTYMVKNL